MSRILNHPLKKIESLTDQDRAALKAVHIEYAEDFLEKMHENTALIDSLISLDDNAKKRVLEAILQFVGKRSVSITENLVNHIPDGIVLLALILFGYSLFFLDRHPAKPEMSKQVVVTAPKGLMPFHVISRSDVEIRDSTKTASALTSVEDVLGRYTTEHIAEGTVIVQFKLSSGPRLSNELDGLRVFNVKLQASPVLVNLNPPVKVGIIPSPRVKDARSEPKIYEVYILEMHPQPDGVSAVVATTAADSSKLASFLSRADLIAVGPVH